MIELRSFVADARELARSAFRRFAAAPALGLALLGACVLVVSVLAYAVAGRREVRRVLFFPDPETLKLVAEEHFIPRARGSEESMRLLMEELLLGPASYELARLFPSSVALRSVSLRDRTLYVDFSTELVLDLGKVPLDLSRIVQAVANNAYFNFPRLRGVYVFVYGQIPELDDIDATRLAYSRDFVR